MVTLKVTNSYVSVHCAATPAGGGWAWPSWNTAGWPRGCGYATTGQAHRSGRRRPARTGQPRYVAMMSWSGCWPAWHWAPSGEGGPR